MVLTRNGIDTNPVPSGAPPNNSTTSLSTSALRGGLNQSTVNATSPSIMTGQVVNTSSHMMSDPSTNTSSLYGQTADGSNTAATSTVSNDLENNISTILRLQTKLAEMEKRINESNTFITANAVTSAFATIAIFTGRDSKTNGKIYTASQFINSMDAAYKRCSVPPELEISYLLGKIRGEAREWWDRLEKDGTSINTWQDFKVALKNEFDNVFTQAQLVSQFRSLNQGKLSVNAFNKEFNRLRHSLQNLPEEFLVHCYIDMLDSKISELVKTHAENLKSLSHAMQSALMQESKVKTIYDALNQANATPTHKAFTTSSEKLQNKKKFLKNEKKRQCLRCQSKQHWTRDCKVEMRIVEPNENKSIEHVAKWCKEEKIFVLDSGATSHMVPKEELLVNVKKSTNIFVKIADGSRVPAIAEGTLILASKQQKFTLDNVLVVPQLDCPLLSCRKLFEAGFTPKFTKTSASILKNNQLILSGINNSNEYTILAQILTHEKALITKNEPSFILWHQRLGHMGKSYVTNYLESNNIKISESDCECQSCLKGKIQRHSFTLSKTVISNIG
jgi:Ty3 transposon capsid-like protein/GAG-pre-integrase domain